jgi:hypothetical protein
MVTPATTPKPDLSRLRTRQIRISANRTKLEFDLLEWVTDVVRHTIPYLGRRRRRIARVA